MLQLLALLPLPVFLPSSAKVLFLPSLMILKGEISKGKLYLKRILDIDPDNAKVEYILSTL